MGFVMRIAAVLLGLAAAQPLLAQTGPAKVQGVVELSGTGATSGTNFNDGVKLAVKEINASGGILGRPIEYAANDTQSQAQVAKALAVKAIDDGAYVIMGPVFSGSIIVSMAETRRAEVPNFTGGEATAITQQGNPYIFRTSLTQTTAMPSEARSRPMASSWRRTSEPGRLSRAGRARGNGPRLDQALGVRQVLVRAGAAPRCKMQPWHVRGSP